MAKRLITLFIEDTAIRLLVTRGKQAEKWLSTPLEPNLVKHGFIQNADKVAAKLKETFASAKIGNRVIVGLSEPGSLYRIITLPKLPDTILAEAVKREAERVIPLPQNEIYLAYQIIASRQDDMQIFLAAFSRNTVDTLINTLNLAGIKPVSLDLVPLALCRAVDRPTAIVVSLRSSNFEIAVMVDRIPQVIRSLSLPGEAESLIDKLPTIAEELERTISFYNSGHTDNPLDSTVPVFVDGELAQSSDTWTSLVGNLGNTVTPLPSLLQAAADFDHNNYTVNVGLSFKENPDAVSGTIVDFNALPKALQQVKTSLSRILIPIGSGVAVLILAFLFLQTNSISNDVKSLDANTTSTQALVAAQNKDITAMKTQVTQAQAKAQPIQDQIKATNATIATFEKLSNTLNTRRNKVNIDTSKIVSLLPATLSISSLNFTDTITLVGIGATEADIFGYARNLKATNLFTSVTLNTITLGESGYTFGLSIIPR
jgi:type IV pilus assembly protein PilM